MGNSNIYSDIIYSNDWKSVIQKWIKKYPAGKIFLATEENVDALWISDDAVLFDEKGIKKVVVPAGEHNKKIGSVEKIWEFLSKNGANRKSLLINIGGGMLTDLAGFAASTFKRGLDFINIPTTLLSQVDASVGGKTGINFNGLKNEIGVFQEPAAVIISTDFLRTIDRDNFISGFAEMIKHGLIYNPKHLSELREFDIENINYELLGEIIRHSVEVKSWFVANDPTEKNIRKALNFGHTIGHAFESLAMEQNRPALHGFTVAYGMIAELYLSAKKCNFPASDAEQLTSWLLKLYGKFEIVNEDFERLFELMTHDKKNEAGRINFTLLPEIGKIAINQNCDREIVYDALQYYSQL